MPTEFQYWMTPTGSSFTSSFVINPVAIDWKDSTIVKVVNTRDGEPVIQRAEYDQRVRTMTWRNYKVSDTNISIMLTDLNALVDSYFYFRDGTVGKFGSWTKCKGVKVEKTYREGGGAIRYATITFHFLVVDSSWSDF